MRGLTQSLFWASPTPVGSHTWFLFLTGRWEKGGGPTASQVTVPGGLPGGAVLLQHILGVGRVDDGTSKCLVFSLCK